MSKKLTPIVNAHIHHNLYENTVKKDLVHVWITTDINFKNVPVLDFYIPCKPNWITSKYQNNEFLEMIEVIKRRLKQEGYVFKNGWYTTSSKLHKHLST